MRSLFIAVLIAVPFVAARPALADDDVSAIWKKKCANCHGMDGKADTKMGHSQKIADMTTDKWQKEWTDSKMKDAIVNGIKKDGKDTKMKAFGDKLKPEEIAGLMKFVRGLAK